jgi:electron transfer flavoprotein beta subunit
MNTAVILRQVPDLSEPLKVSRSGTALDLHETHFCLNEFDNQALEQALEFKETSGGTVSAFALDYGEADDILYVAAAEGVDRIFKIHTEHEMPPTPRAEATIFAEALEAIRPDLVLIGSRAPDELEGMLGPALAVALGWPYAGGIHGVHPCLMETRVQAFKEFPGDVLARMSVRLPAVLGILAAERTPRYVPVANIREVMTTVEIEELEIAARETEPTATVRWLHTAKP